MISVNIFNISIQNILQFLAFLFFKKWENARKCLDLLHPKSLLSWSVSPIQGQAIWSTHLRHSNKIQFSSIQYVHNFPGICLLCKRKSIGASLLFLISVPPPSFSSELPRCVLPPPLVLTEGYLGIVGAHRAAAVPGAVRVTIPRIWKQVVPLLLRPRLHEIYH